MHIVPYSLAKEESILRLCSAVLCKGGVPKQGTWVPAWGKMSVLSIRIPVPRYLNTQALACNALYSVSWPLCEYLHCLGLGGAGTRGRIAGKYLQVDHCWVLASLCSWALCPLHGPVANSDQALSLSLTTSSRTLWLADKYGFSNFISYGSIPSCSKWFRSEMPSQMLSSKWCNCSCTAVDLVHWSQCQ